MMSDYIVTSNSWYSNYSFYGFVCQKLCNILVCDSLKSINPVTEAVQIIAGTCCGW